MIRFDGILARWRARRAALLLHRANESVWAARQRAAIVELARASVEAAHQRAAIIGNLERVNEQLGRLNEQLGRGNLRMAGRRPEPPGN